MTRLYPDHPGGLTLQARYTDSPPAADIIVNVPGTEWRIHFRQRRAVVADCSNIQLKAMNALTDSTSIVMEEVL